MYLTYAHVGIGSAFKPLGNFPDLFESLSIYSVDNILSFDADDISIFN